MYGVNPEHHAQLGRTLQEQMSVIAQLMSTVDHTIGSTTWQAPARQRFEQGWIGSFKHTLHRLDEAFGSAGQDCIARSEELLRVMGG